MDKKTDEILEKFNELLKTIENDDQEIFRAVYLDSLAKAFFQPCKITIKKDKKGGFKFKLSGHRLAILMALVASEKPLLKELHCKKEEFNFIKSIVE